MNTLDTQLNMTTTPVPEELIQAAADALLRFPGIPEHEARKLEAYINGEWPEILYYWTSPYTYKATKTGEHYGFIKERAWLRLLYSVSHSCSIKVKPHYAIDAYWASINDDIPF